MRFADMSSWQGMLLTIVMLTLVTVIGVGIRLLVMQTIQERRQRENRQINERLRILIAAYKTLGGSFTGQLAVDPTHMRDLRRRPEHSTTSPDAPSEGEMAEQVLAVQLGGSSDRSRRIRDAVESALSDILLLGTDEQVKLAAQAAAELVAGRRVHTAELVTSLRNFIRQVLDLAPVPLGLAIPLQGPTRPTSSSGRGGGNRGEGGRAGGARGGAGGGGGGGGSAGAAGLGGAAAGESSAGDLTPGV
ncbi:MAG: hypothetical protein ACT4NL_11295 [Pseudomarimonas sp.]